MGSGRKDSSASVSSLEIDYHPLGFDEELGETPEFKYLANSSREDLTRWQKEYGKTLRELENFLAEHKVKYNWNLFIYWMARLTNIPYVVFGAAKSHIGIKEFVKAFFPEVEVPDNVAYPIGLSLTVLSAACYMAAISPEQLALTKTLKEANSNWIMRAMKFYAEYQENKCQALGYAVNQTLLSTVNFSTATGNSMGIMPLLNRYPPAWWTVFPLMQYFSMRFYDGFSNKEFWEGVNFLFDSKFPSVFKVMFSYREFLLGFHTLCEGVSPSVLRSAANYVIAKEGIEKLGVLLPPPLLIGALSLYVYSCILYPTTYHHYLDSYIKVRDLISESAEIGFAVQAAIEKEADEEIAKNVRTVIAIELTEKKYADDSAIFEAKKKEIKETLSNERNKNSVINLLSTDKHIKKIHNTLVREKYKKLEAEVKQENGCGYLFKREPVISLPMCFYLLVGIYYGFEWGIGSALLGESLFGVPYYGAQNTRVKNDLIEKKLNESQSKTTKNDLTSCQKAAVVGSTALVTLSGGLSGFTTAVGLGREAVPPAAIGIYSVASFLAMMNGIGYGWGKVRNTMQSFFGTKKQDPSVARSGLFSSPVSDRIYEVPGMKEEKRSNWCCFRKK